jgi:guanidinopropionase
MRLLPFLPKGPREIRNKSCVIRRQNQATGVRPFDVARVADVGDAWVQRPYGLQPAGVPPPDGSPAAEPLDPLRGPHDEIQHFFNALTHAGASPVTAGGDHSISLPILRALRRAVGQPLALVHLDAHQDTAPPAEVAASTGSRYPNYTPFSCAAEEGLIDPARCIQIGIRGPCSGGTMLSRSLGFTVIEMEEFYDRRARSVAAQARALVGDAPVYVTFDVDALDPSYALGTGSPEDGGLTTLEAQILLRSLRGARVVGSDFVCTSPVWDVTGNTPRVAANMMFEQLCLVAEARAIHGRPFKA